MTSLLLNVVWWYGVFSGLATVLVLACGYLWMIQARRRAAEERRAAWKAMEQIKPRIWRA